MTKYLRLTSIGQGKTPKLLTSYIVEITDCHLEKGMRVILNGRLFDIKTVINKPGNPKTRITGNFV